MGSKITVGSFQENFNSKAYYVIDHTIFKLFNPFFKAIEANSIFLIEQPEAQKTWDGLEQLLRFYMQINLNKSSKVTAVGGGAVLDLVGFACSIFKRGISFDFVPTTLLSMVDASIGGKNGINFCGVKNLVGTIQEPSSILIDINFLKTLPKKEILSGFAEMLKIAMIASKKLFEELIQNPLSERLIQDCILLKKEIVAKDLYDKHLRHVLNFGHTVGHAYEAALKGTVPHGFAVALGIMIESKVSFNRGILNADCYQKIMNTIRDIYFPFEKVAFEVLSPYIHQDKKCENGIKMHILETLGSYPELKEVSISEIQEAYESTWM